MFDRKPQNIWANKKKGTKKKGIKTKYRREKRREL
jgi:hypothetical protein